jgi:hypothetical protein
MKEEHSEDSMLRGMSRDQLMISSIIDTTEKHVRAMCRAMQVYELNACDRIDNVEQDYQDLTAVFSAFYDYVDKKMDDLSELSRELEHGLAWVSIEKLRASEDFRRKPLPPHAFVSRAVYLEYCSKNGFEPVSLADSQARGS